MAIVQNDYAAYLKTSDGEIPLRDLDAHEEIGSLSEDNMDTISIINAIFRSAGYNTLLFNFIEWNIDSATGNVGVNKNNVITDFISSDSFID